MGEPALTPGSRPEFHALVPDSVRTQRLLPENAYPGGNNYETCVLQRALIRRRLPVSPLLPVPFLSVLERSGQFGAGRRAKTGPETDILPGPFRASCKSWTDKCPPLAGKAQLQAALVSAFAKSASGPVERRNARTSASEFPGQEMTRFQATCSSARTGGFPLPTSLYGTRHGTAYFLLVCARTAHHQRSAQEIFTRLRLGFECLLRTSIAPAPSARPHHKMETLGRRSNARESLKGTWDALQRVESIQACMPRAQTISVHRASTQPHQRACVRACVRAYCSPLLTA